MVKIRTIDVYTNCRDELSALKMFEFELACARASDEHILKIYHGEASGSNQGKIKYAIRRRLRELQASGKVKAWVKGERFSPSDTSSMYIINKCPAAEYDDDYNKKNREILIIYF